MPSNKNQNHTRIILAAIGLAMTIVASTITVSHLSGKVVHQVDVLTSEVRNHRETVGKSIEKLDLEKLDVAVFKQSEQSRIRWEQSIDSKLDRLLTQ